MSAKGEKRGERRSTKRLRELTISGEGGGRGEKKSALRLTSGFFGGEKITKNRISQTISARSSTNSSFIYIIAITCHRLSACQVHVLIGLLRLPHPRCSLLLSSSAVHKNIMYVGTDVVRTTASTCVTFMPY